MRLRTESCFWQKFQHTGGCHDHQSQKNVQNESRVQKLPGRGVAVRWLYSADFQGNAAAADVAGVDGIPCLHRAGGNDTHHPVQGDIGAPSDSR